jgi:hypothetical protein
MPSRPLPSLSLAALLVLGAATLRADDHRYGILKIHEPGTWHLVLFDRLRAEGNSFSSDYSKYPFWATQSTDPETIKKDHSRNIAMTKEIDGKTGSFTLFKAGVAVKEFKATGDDFEIEGNRDYVLRFNYNLVGIKSFKRVFELYRKGAAIALIAVESQATGSQLTVKKVAQADHDEAYGKFKPGYSKKYTFTVDGALYEEASKANGNLIQVDRIP